jgi:hypothetical protein
VVIIAFATVFTVGTAKPCIINTILKVESSWRAHLHVVIIDSQHSEEKLLQNPFCYFLVSDRLCHNSFKESYYKKTAFQEALLARGIRMFIK